VEDNDNTEANEANDEAEEAREILRQTRDILRIMGVGMAFMLVLLVGMELQILTRNDTLDDIKEVAEELKTFNDLLVPLICANEPTFELCEEVDRAGDQEG
jgi:hypothetical protein